MNPRVLIVAAVLAASGLALGVSSAHAFGRHQEMRARLGQEVDEALAAVKATPAQRKQVRGAVGEVLRTASEALGGTEASSEVDEILRIFDGDRIDDRALRDVRTRREAKHSRLGDALVDAFDEIHGAFSADQRRTLTEYAKQKAQGRHLAAWKDKLLRSLVNAQIDDILDQLGASESERRATYQARDEVLAALEAARADRDTRMEELASLFRGDTLDRATLQRFRHDSERKIAGVMDAAQSAIHRLHDGLTPAHRQQLVQLVRDRRLRHQAARGAEPTEF